MKALRLLLALTLAWLLCASKSRADAFGNRAWGKSAYQSVITPDDEWQTLVRYRENPTGYDETASGQEVWTKTDPLGEETEDQYDQDAANAQKEATRKDYQIQQSYQNGEYGDPKGPEAQAKAATLTQDENAQRDSRVTADEQGKANLQSTAKWARDHNIAVDESTLDDDPGHSSAVGPTMSSLLGVDSPRDPATAGQAQYASIRESITKAGAEEVVKQAAAAMMPGGEEAAGGEELAAESEAIAGKITGYTKHGINSAISHDGVGVSPEAILDAVKNPADIVKQADGAIKYVGKDATVVLNKDGKVITTFANGSAGVRSPP